MPNKITDTAQMQCDKGSMPSQLKVTSQQFKYVDGKLVATEEDINPNTNIPPFGVCSITKKSCTPNGVKWENISEKNNIQNLKILLETSTCKCIKGGNIKFINKGHSISSFVDK